MTFESPPRIPAPTLPETSAPYTFPLVATLAPVALSGVAWWLTQSVLSLVFAALGPMIAIGSLLDARLQSRRRRGREGARFRRELESARAEVERAHGVERAQREAEHPREPPAPRWTELGDGPLPLRLGSGVVSSPVRLEGVPPASRSPSAEALQLEQLRRSSVELADAPVVADALGGIGVVGPQLAAVALARSLLLQLAARLSPAEWRLEARGGGWSWLEALPHEVQHGATAAEGAVLRWLSAERVITVSLGRERRELPGGLATIVDLAGEAIGNPERFSAEEARARAAELARLAAERGLLRSAVQIPDRVALDELIQPTTGLAAAIGRGNDGPVVVDLVRDGPHAIVGGTTGSGKSELLISWLLALADTRSPDQLTLLLVDFKGGAAFGALSALPHCVGLVTDLDDDTAERALESLAAELRYRERTLAEAGVRSIEQLPELPRLVIVVDEYAAVAQGHPHLNALFSDLAARGRSLGIHLILCTQRPSGVVRDAILANSGLRISLRVNNRSDSAAVIGVDDAALVPAAARGRALLSAHGEKPVAVQLALATPADVDSVLAAWRSRDWRPRRPWRNPLPARIALRELRSLAEPETESGPETAKGLESATVPGPVTGPGIPFGLADHPAEQAQPVARWNAPDHGHLLVIGAAASGRSTALDTIASGATGAVRLSAGSAEAAWDAVTTLLEQARGGVRARDVEHLRRDEQARLGGSAPTTLLIDDLDALLARLGEDHRAELVDRLCALLREGSASGIRIAIALQRTTGSLGSVAALAGSRLLLRLPDRQEHVLAGGTGETYRDRLPPGAGLWQGHRVQVAMGEPREPDARERIQRFDPAEHPMFAVVAARPDDTARRLVAAGVDPGSITRDGSALNPGQTTGLTVGAGERRVLLADSETWQSHWGAISTLRGRVPILFDGCSLADYRSLTRERELPPPLRTGTAQLWLLTPEGSVRRAELGI
ncbi:hypothetical protein EYE40_02425 [Glaciihabitans arcticus]|uniref:FtsK domain-containing protein n=1 Tax=Glaciihabitans arcticus TaxID=2668039 RepID=A0A4Q9GNP9_9MICO|nr:FtsK/SpoIIIE domain-containing protein [Glaciihabitans arcticus]TBN56341.1 hypothetical protein EYE40_02425 [Glaciihabitans arcticus]